MNEVHSLASDETLMYCVFSDHAVISGPVDKDISGKLVIPDEFDGKPVTAIWDNAFKEMDIASVKGGSNIEAIGFGAFDDTPWLENAHKSAEMLMIGKVLVYPGGITGRYTAPEGVVSLYPCSFQWVLNSSEPYHDFTQMITNSVVLPEGMESIGSHAFYGSRVQSVYIPRSVDYIGYYALDNCIEIWYEGTEEEWNALTASAKLKEDTVIHFGAEGMPPVDYAITESGLVQHEAHSIESDGVFDYAVYRDQAAVLGIADKEFSGKLVIPAEINGRPVKVIGESAFKGMDITSVKGGDNVEVIGSGAFDDTPWLENAYKSAEMLMIGKVLVYPGGITGRYTAPEGVVSIYPEAFKWVLNSSEPYHDFTQMITNSVVLPEGMKIIGEGVFYGSRVQSVYIPRSVDYIGYYALDNCKEIWYEGTEEEWNALTASVKIKEDTVIHFGAEGMPPVEYAITESGLVQHEAHSIESDGVLDYVVYNDQAAVIGIADKEYAGEVVIPAEFDGRPVTGIYSNAFMGAEITSVEIPDTVTDIFDGAFDDCTQLAEIKGGKNVSVHVGLVFVDSGLRYTPWYAEKVLKGEPVILGNTLIYAGLCTGDYVMPENITAVESFALEPHIKGEHERPDPASVTISDGVKYIPDSLLRSCGKANDVYIPVSVEKVAKNAFVFKEEEGSGVKDIWYAGTPAQWSEISGDLKIPGYVTVHYGAAGIGDKNAAVKVAGDANCDGKVNVADAVGVLQYIANATKYPLTEEGVNNADCDGNRGITGTDAITIQKIDAGII